MEKQKMEKRFYFISLFIVIALLVIALTGCDRITDAPDVVPDDVSSEEMPVPVIVFRPDDVFVPEYTSLSILAGDLPNVSNIIVTESSLYLTSANDKRNDQFFQVTNIFTVDHNEGVLTFLPNYRTVLPPAGAEGGSMLICAMQIDPDGCIWVIEENKYLTFDFPPDFDAEKAEISEIMEHQKPLISTYFLRKLDKTGAELLSVDITATVLTTQDSADTFALYVDDEENIFVGTGQLIFVFDIEGNIKFTFGTESFVRNNSLIKLSDGRVTFSGWNNDRATWTLQVIDIYNGEWGITIDLPQNTQDVLDGNDEYLVLINNGMSLIGIDKRTNEEIVVFNWIDSGIWPVGVANVVFLPDYHFMFTMQSPNHTDLVVQNRLLRYELPEITVLTIASFMPHLISPAIAEFNRTNYTYHVEIVELDLNTWTESTENLLSDIKAGTGPDMIHTYRLPSFRQWAGQELFEDLYKLIDADPMLNRSDFVESVLKGFEVDGKLNQMAPGFNIGTLIGHPDVIGRDMGWGVEDFIKVIETNPQATLPLGPSFDGYQILYMIISNNINSFINRETGTVYFDSNDFISLLEFVYTVESNIDRNSIGLTDYIPYQRIFSGEQIMEPVRFNRFVEYSVFQDLFGGDFVFKGLPAENGSGNYIYSDYCLAVTVESENKDGAREFLRLFLSRGWQRQTLDNTNYMAHYIPTNKMVLEERFAEAMDGFRFPNVIYGDLAARGRPLTQEQNGKIRELINSVSTAPLPLDESFTNLYMEVMTEYFSGNITAQETAEIMQNKVSIYLSEHS